ncbi:hypothetical protein [Marinobacterium stanieri]|uniref:Uncharacterized protein n=1 Tax=Marinobacterium stanieri TaxID=49186 RepID=A0A1N6S694_9GAMM|nr:hypothetical protein [Marinobacterium stanieri]SIQ36614.1 hypothetical protein SAMN05421647_10453 [Marinobacterium stanieri]
MKPDIAQEDTSLLSSFRALLPKGVSLLIGSVVFQCISVGVLVAIGVNLSKSQGFSSDDFLPPVMLGGAFAVILLVTGVFLVVMQKSIGIYLCRFNAWLWTLLTAASWIYDWIFEQASSFSLYSTGLLSAVSVLALYSSQFLHGYIARAKAIRQEFWNDRV